MTVIVAELATLASPRVAKSSTDWRGRFRYAIRMDRKYLAEWLKSAIAHAKITQAKLSSELTLALGRSVDKFAVSKMTLEKRDILADELVEIARITGYPAPVAQSRPPLNIPLVGYVGANARADVINFSEGHGNFDSNLYVPPQSRETTVAVEVRGDSMRGMAKDGWRVYYDADDIREPPFSDLLGELCVCWLADGRVLLKELHKGSRPDLFILESMNADTLRDEHVIRATIVTAIVPHGKRPRGDNLSEHRMILKAK